MTTISMTPNDLVYSYTEFEINSGFDISYHECYEIYNNMVLWNTIYNILKLPIGKLYYRFLKI